MQPVRLRYFNVVIQEQQIFAGCRRGAVIVEARPIEWLRHVDDAVRVFA